LIRHYLLEHHRIHTTHHRIHHHLLLLLLLLMLLMTVHSHPSTAAHHSATMRTARDWVDLSLHMVKSTMPARWLDTVEQTPHRLRLVAGRAFTHGTRPVR
jgi:hypothetical protein